MSFIENWGFQEILPVIDVENFGGKGRIFSEYFVEKLSQSMSNTNCNSSSSELDMCRDHSSTLGFKLIAIASILVAGVLGIGIPLFGKKQRFLHTDGNLFIAAKAFAAGVILATGFVHMLPDATEALTNSCLPVTPWLKFPFSGFFAMLAALATLVVDFVGTQYYERKHEKKASVTNQIMCVDESDGEVGIIEVEEKDNNEKECGGMHIVGIHAHAAHHGHGEDSNVENGHAHGHSHGFGDDDDGGVRHVVVSQILELGIVSHSVIIGLSLGVSQSSCTIRPLIAALSFHQFFEGFALGGCISQAQYKTISATLMAFFFAVTTPIGISIGIGISSFYNASSPRALVIEGTLDSMSAGILVYMALVDLIAADFLSKKMRSNVRLQVVSYFALFLGALMMSSLAIWA